MHFGGDSFEWEMIVSFIHTSAHRTNSALLRFNQLTACLI